MLATPRPRAAASRRQQQYQHQRSTSTTGTLCARPQPAARCWLRQRPRGSAGWPAPRTLVTPESCTTTVRSGGVCVSSMASVRFGRSAPPFAVPSKAPAALPSMAVARSAAASETRAAFLLPAARRPPPTAHCPCRVRCSLLCSALLCLPARRRHRPSLPCYAARCTRLYLRRSTIRAVPVPSRLSASTPDRPCSYPETPAGAKRASPFDPAPIPSPATPSHDTARLSLAGLHCSHCRPQR